MRIVYHGSEGNFCKFDLIFLVNRTYFINALVVHFTALHSDGFRGGLTKKEGDLILKERVRKSGEDWKPVVDMTGYEKWDRVKIEATAWIQNNYPDLTD